jgi:uncharacterized protein YuzE
VKLDGHYDGEADIAWFRSERYEADTVIAEETDIGLREIDPSTGEIVGVEFWQATRVLPDDLLRVLESPPFDAVLSG